VAAIFGQSFWIYIGLTYDNGDMSDNWCGTHTSLPPGMIGATFYTAPKCGERNLFAISSTGTQNVLWKDEINYYICM